MNNVAEKLDIEDEVEPLEINEEVCTFSEDASEDASEDYKFIRKKLRKAVSFSEALIGLMFQNIQLSSGPRTVEGCSQIIKMMIDASKELHLVHERQSKILKNKSDNGGLDKKGKKSKSYSLNEILDAINEKEEGGKDGD